MTSWFISPNNAFLSKAEANAYIDQLNELMHKFIKMNPSVYGRLVASELFQRIVNRVGKEHALKLFFSFPFDRVGKTVDDKKYQRLIKLVIQSCVELRQDAFNKGVLMTGPLPSLALDPKIALRSSHKELAQNAKRYVQKYSKEAKQFFNVTEPSRGQQKPVKDDIITPLTVSAVVLVLGFLAQRAGRVGR